MHIEAEAAAEERDSGRRLADSDTARQAEVERAQPPDDQAHGQRSRSRGQGHI